MTEPLTAKTLDGRTYAPAPYEMDAKRRRHKTDGRVRSPLYNAQVCVRLAFLMVRIRARIAAGAAPDRPRSGEDWRRKRNRRSPDLRKRHRHRCVNCGLERKTPGPEVLPKGWVGVGGLAWCDKCAAWRAAPTDKGEVYSA